MGECGMEAAFFNSEKEEHHAGLHVNQPRDRLSKRPPAKCFRFLNPTQTLLPGAHHYHGKRPAVHCSNTAKIKDASPPENFQGIAEHALFSRFCRVRRVQDDRRTCTEQADRNALPTVAFIESVSNAGTEHAINPALQDSRGLAPPVRVHNDDPVCGTKFVAVHLHLRVDLARLRNLLGKKKRVEAFCAEVMEHDVVPAFQQVIAHGMSDGMV